MAAEAKTSRLKKWIRLSENSARLFQLALSNVGELSWDWTLNKNIQVEKEKDKLSLRCMPAGCP